MFRPSDHHQLRRTHATNKCNKCNKYRRGQSVPTSPDVLDCFSMPCHVLVLHWRCPRTTLAAREEGEPSAAVNHSRVNCCCRCFCAGMPAAAHTSKGAMVTRVLYLNLNKSALSRNRDHLFIPTSPKMVEQTFLWCTSE